MDVPLVNLNAQYQTIKPAVDAAIARVLSRSAFVLGEEVRVFEEAFAGYCATSYAIGVDSGYSALEMIMRAYEIGPGDEVITTANTFIATALAIWACGAKPVFVDIDAQTYNLDPSKLEAAITKRTRAILPVHLFGHPADMGLIVETARRHGLLVIEDACQAHGARYMGRRAGSLGDAAAFSFYPSKNLGAYGDGGMVVTDDRIIGDRVRMLRDVGQRCKNDHQIKGYNHRLDNLQAAVLLAKFPHLDEWNSARRTAASLYNRLFDGVPISVPYEADWAEHVYHLYVIRVRERDQVQASLAQAGISSGIHYPTPIHLQPAFQDLSYRPGDLPVTERSARELLSLPMYPEIKEKEIAYIAETIRTSIMEHVG